MEPALIIGVGVWGALGFTVLGLASLILAIVAWVSVFRDDNLSGGSKAMWFFAILIFPIFGSVIYFGVRSSW
jgi:hypothetical protein